MPSWRCCPDGHSTKEISTDEAAIAVSEGRAIGVCKKCGKELQYRIDHVYANDPSGKEYGFIVTLAVRLGTRPTDCKSAYRSLRLPNFAAAPGADARGACPVRGDVNWKLARRRTHGLV